jgi:hypothetical protein
MYFNKKRALVVNRLETFVKLGGLSHESHRLYVQSLISPIELELRVRR